MGDHAASIAKATIRVKGEERLPEVEAEIKKWVKPFEIWLKKR
ncbi:Phosphate transport system regulatory protein PhoU [Streptococcus sp. HSISB1]|nr:Phosphate transport system regulatory protein PhoU [Streptococcus sp. HSISB1]